MVSKNSNSKVKSYKDLFVWQRAHKLAIEIYELSKERRKSFADWEIWRQVIKAAFSVPANIAEGYHTHRGKAFVSHLEIARGSEGETDYWLLVLMEIGQVDQVDATRLGKECQEIIAMLTGLISKVNR